MTGGLTIGPFSFSAGLLTSFVAVLVVLLVGERLGRKRGADVELRLWIVVAVGVIAARAAYVVRFADVYLESPLTMLDIRDGGFRVLVGLAAAMASAALLGWRNRLHRVPLLLGASAGAAVFVLAALAERLMPPAAQLPQLTLTRLEGGALAIGALAGTPVVVNLWASWCGPCRREMPVLRQAQIEHPEITFIFVNQAETSSAIRDYLGRERMVLNNIVLDTGSVMARTLGSKGLPTTFFFDSSGKLAGRRVGEVSAATLTEQLASLHRPHPAPSK